MKKKKNLFLLIAFIAFYFALSEEKASAPKERPKIDIAKELTELNSVAKTYEYEKKDKYSEVVKNYPLTF